MGKKYIEGTSLGSRNSGEPCIAVLNTARELQSAENVLNPTIHLYSWVPAENAHFEICSK